MVGKYISATRNDGRFFCGEVVKTTDTAKGKLVVVKSGESHKSFYMENVKSFHITDSNDEKFISYCESFRQLCDSFQLTILEQNVGQRERKEKK